MNMFDVVSLDSLLILDARSFPPWELPARAALMLRLGSGFSKGTPNLVGMMLSLTPMFKYTFWTLLIRLDAWAITIGILSGARLYGLISLPSLIEFFR